MFRLHQQRNLYEQNILYFADAFRLWMKRTRLVFTLFSLNSEGCKHLDGS